MSNYYCEHCGQPFINVKALTAGNCTRHPNGLNKGKHALYKGSEKSSYMCKFCGQSFPTISSMTAGHCQRHPDGNMKGRHSPAL